jgi:hypothetical protein
MALDYGAILPSQTEASGSYPQGKAKNVSAPGAGDGTPWYANLVNDLLFGPWQAILRLTGTVPSGVPDTANTTQYMEALMRWMWGTLISSNWTIAAQGSEHYNAVCFSPTLGTFVAVGENGKVFATDGLLNAMVTIGGAPDLNAVVWSASANLFIACGDGGAMYTSPTGATWTSRASTVVEDLLAIAVKPGSPDTIVAVGASGTIVSSTNGTAWTPRVAAVGASFFGICYAATLGAGLFVAVCNGGQVETSADGVTWADGGVTPGSTNFNAVIWSTFHSLLIAVGSGGSVETSPDAVTWTDQGDQSTGRLYGVTVDETLGQIIAVGENGIVASFDAVTWYSRFMYTGGNLKAAAFSAIKGFTLAVGNLGVTFTSLRGLHP